MQDPFHLVKEEVQQTLTGINAFYERWKELLNSTNTSENDEFKWTQSELKEHLKNINYDLTDLEETIKIAESNTQKFRLDDDELLIRKHFVESTRKRVKLISDEMNDTSTKAKLDRDTRSSLMAHKDEKKIQKRV